MARLILVYGQPAAGKSYACKTLDPKKTVIIDGDRKGALPWRGWKNDYVAGENFFPAVSLDKTINRIEEVAKSDDFKHVTTIVVDGLNNIMSIEDTAAYFGKRPQYKGKYDVYEGISQKTIWLVEIAKSYRADLDVIFTAHVKTADPYAPGEVDRLFTPGKALENKKKIEGSFLYVFYAKVDGDGNHILETCPIHSTARSPEGCFPATIPNDMQMIIDTINAYDLGGHANE